MADEQPTPKPGELWRPTSGGRWVQVLDADDKGVLFDRGREGAPGEWQPIEWWKREMQPLITLGSKWRFRDGSGKSFTVTGFIGGVSFDFDSADRFMIGGYTLSPPTWPIRKFLLNAIPEARP